MSRDVIMSREPATAVMPATEITLAIAGMPVTAGMLATAVTQQLQGRQ